MNTELFQWTFTVTINEGGDIINAHVDSKHKFKASEAAEAFAAKISDFIGTSIDSVALNRMAVESGLCPPPNEIPATSEALS